jgi:spermidine dehydrogenase
MSASLTSHENMKPSVSDRRLGLGARIPRRDFLQGMLVGAAASLCTPLRKSLAAAAQDAAGYYPPLLTGLRGSHPGSFEAAHALRDGQIMSAARDTGENYDLVVVGGGISGLAAAHFFRARYGASSRILILENHDDFGGHAKRNEFSLDGRTQLLNGGTLSIESPRPYGAVADGLLRTLGIDVDALVKETQHNNFYAKRGLSDAVFFDRETFGVDRLVRGGRGHLASISHYPLGEKARADIHRIESGQEDFMPGLSSAQKKDRLSRMSYRDFLVTVVKVDPETLKLYQCMTHGWWGVGIDAVSALDCWGTDFSGFKGMHLAHGATPRMGFTPAGFADTGGSEDLHFPDGNATVARLLVRDLLPGAVPGGTARDVVSARVDYAKLDVADSLVRLRLNSIAVRAANVGEGTEVTYLQGGNAYRVSARRCVLACWNMMIPYLVPELPEVQKAALHELVKTPLVYSSVALRNWQAFDKLKIRAVYAPGGYHTNFNLNWKVDVGDYRSIEDPSQPILVHMSRTPCQPGLSEHEQNKAGRAELLATSFETFERNIRDQLARSLSGGGFDPARDIRAITVNRWPHGYAPEYNPLFEPEGPESSRPHVIGRAPFGNITIANSDSGGGAYTDVAIEQAYRAVQELKS